MNGIVLVTVEFAMKARGFTEDTCRICKWKCTAHEWDSSGNCRICEY